MCVSGKFYVCVCMYVPATVVQVSLSHGDETDIMLQCRVYFLAAEYSRALHVMESRGLCSSPEPQHLQIRALTAQCLVSNDTLVSSFV